MYRTTTVGIVVPAYNEAAHIAFVLDGIPSFVDAVYVVDDKSVDKTRDIIHEWAARDSRIHLLTHGSNRGVGAAVVTGYRGCLAEHLDIAVVMAGDNQMDPTELPGLLDPIVEERADYVKGDRTSRPEDLVGMSSWRRLGNLVLRWLTRIAVGSMRLNDPQNGYTAIRRELLSVLPLTDLFPRYGYCNQLLCWILLCGARWVEVPMPSRYLGEKSKIRYWRYIPSVSWLLARLLAERITNRGVAGRLSRAGAPSTRPGRKCVCVSHGECSVTCLLSHSNVGKEVRSSE